MTSHGKETNRILDRFIEELGEPMPSTVRMRRATSRVLENLARVDPFVAPAGQANSVPPPQMKRHWAPVAAVAAGLCAVAVLVGTLSMPSSAEPIAKRLSGKLIAPGDNDDIGEGKLIRTEESDGEVIALRDGSQMELSAGVELSINRAADGIQIDLSAGNIIVTAAKQRNGHLYVKTRDCMVSVVGTVFSVKAEATGSRVAVIEGEVQVQHGDVSQTLLQGQHVATNIGWSQDPAVQVAMLQQAPAPATPTTPATAAAPVVNPDMVGEIRLILAAVDQELEASLVLKNRTLFNALWQGSIDNQLLRQPGLPNGFLFTITGIQGRTILFSNSKNETFSFGCADCSFVVSENGVSKSVSTSEQGVEFKLSADGTALTATCRASECSLLSLTDGSSVLSRGLSAIGGSFQGLSYSNFSRSIFMIPSSQLSQQGGSVVFAVTKPAGQ